MPVLLSWESGLLGEGGEKDGYCTEYEERLLHSSSEPNTWEGLLHNSKLDTWEGLLHNSKLDTREGLLHNSSKPNGENSVLEACFLAGGLLSCGERRSYYKTSLRTSALVIFWISFIGLP